MQENLAKIKTQFEQDVLLIDSIDSWSAMRDKYLSRKNGLLTQAMKLTGKLPPEQRAGFGQDANTLKALVESELDRARAELDARAETERLKRESIDITLPGRKPKLGHLHPITLIRQRIEDIFVAMGYSVEDGPEIETNYYNFDALNIPEGHPARESSDTLFISSELALRSQTSTIQIRALERRKPPLRVIGPGRVFRRDTPDPTHNPMFYQLEALVVGHGITMADLKGTISEFVHQLFGPDLKTRFRPSYFPFVEPGAEADYSCFVCRGSGCRTCKMSGWIEMGGSGMVHPRVLEMAGVDPDEFSGFAFGFGIDRMAALMYNIDDIRLLFQNDVRFLEQFA
ncbi:MAG TPA: phenylalanine--tRNA ligase subunit alpha [Blastocatellia bacterium]|nr:phenylalanine--tRNA ligase subunit alpha [Blastocatellia bacterium]